MYGFKFVTAKSVGDGNLGSQKLQVIYSRERIVFEGVTVLVTPLLSQRITYRDKLAPEEHGNRCNKNRTSKHAFR